MLVLGGWVGLACERTERGPLRSRVPLLLAGHGWEEIKWAEVGGKCSMSSVQYSAEGCCDACTVYMVAGKGVRFKVLGLRKHFSVEIYAVLLLNQETAMNPLQATIENAEYALVTPWVSCSDRKD